MAGADARPRLTLARTLTLALTLTLTRAKAGFPVSEEELILMGAELGSDIGFFLARGTAMCS